MLRLLVLIVSACTICGYQFDKSSCDNMLPKFDVIPATGNQTGKGHSEDVHENESERKEMQGTNKGEDLSPAMDASPYKLSVSSNKYRRNRAMTVKFEGGEFNGFLVQVRQYERGTSLGAALIGSFVDLPSGIGTLDCYIGPNYSVANTAFSKNETIKKDLQLKWKAPTSDVGSIEFVATIIRGQQFWTSVKSQSLLFNEFPPSLEECGKDRSCYRYSDVHQGCAESGICDYVVVSQVVHDDVIFTIGGRIKSGMGYVGIGFTDDLEKMSFVDMCVCMKTSSQKAEAAHYMIRKKGGTPEKQNVQMEDAETDVDGNNVWCRFRRPLFIPGSQAADLNKDLFQLFLWGDLDSSGNPILPKQDKMVSVMEKWNRTQTLNVIHYVGEASITKIGWTLVLAALVATLIQL